MDGKKYTVAWYVDNNKLSYMDPVVHDAITKYLTKQLG